MNTTFINDPPSVAAVIPNYNYGAFIPTLIKSLSEQTLSVTRIIFVDDGSTDNSLEVIFSERHVYASFFNRFDVISLGQNHGKLAALNIACQNISEDITLIVDSDDYLDRQFIERTVHHLLQENIKDCKVSFVYTDSQLIDNEGNIVSKGKSFPFDAELLKSKSYIPECAPTFTSVLKEALPFSEEIRVGTKHHKWMRLINQGWKGTYISEPLFFYRMHANNLSGIGKRVLSEIKKTHYEEKILSGYWSCQTSEKIA